MSAPRFSQLIATGAALPAHRVSNAELVQRLAAQGIDTSDEWIVSRSGIKARYFAPPHQMTSDLAAAAGREALTRADLAPNEIDLLIVATSTPDHLGAFPSTACITQTKLGITNHSAAFDVQAVCSGFIYALSVADAMIKSGMAQRAMVIGSEVFSRILDFTDRATCVLFGDGAAAVILQAGEAPGILASALHADGTQRDILCVNGHLAAGTVQGSGYVHMEGQAVFKLAIDVLAKVATEVLTKAQLTAHDIDWLVPHQANLRIMDATAKKLGLPPEKVIRTVHEHGNTSAASIPLALHQGLTSGAILPQQKLLLEGVGGGFTWGALVLQTT